MGMGYAAANTTIITEKNLKGLNLKSYDEFYKWFEDRDLEVSDFAMDSQYMYDEFECSDECEEGDWEKMETIYANLCDEFNEATGLYLDIDYHNSEDEGSRYDDVNGVYWNVGGVYVRTEAAIKFENLIESASFVTFG